ncbi:MAG TPA: hypothetical protein VFQ45_05270 [Longimicrobium sp.]|nr:hypothetical protein [Longimicrobium sp.]
MIHARRHPLTALSAAIALLVLGACSALPTAPDLAPGADAARNGGDPGNGTRDADSIPATQVIIVTTGGGEGCG